MRSSRFLAALKGFRSWLSVSAPEDTIPAKLRWAKLSGGSEKHLLDALRVYEVQAGIRRHQSGRARREVLARMEQRSGTEDLLAAGVQSQTTDNLAYQGYEMPDQPVRLAEPTQSIRLTEYSHGAGCGCKIAPAVLTRILAGVQPIMDPRVLVGNGARDDAAVYALDEDRVVISTTDFFMPIVDDPFEFGAIASTNAISDVYAMGGTPILAIAILGWPVNTLEPAAAGQVLQGANEACRRAGIALAGGHSIDAPEPIFGLAVTGTARRADIRTNAQAREGCELYLTKPLGVGILTTAQKKGVLRDEDFAMARELMLTLNDLGPELARLGAVATMTDVTGFGLLGHLLEVCEGSGLSAEIRFDAVPRLDVLPFYLNQGTLPGGTKRNFESYGPHVGPMTDEQRAVLCDPQTSGGLLVAVDPDGREDFLGLTRTRGLDLAPFGVLKPAEEPTVTIV